MRVSIQEHLNDYELRKEAEKCRRCALALLNANEIELAQWQLSAAFAYEQLRLGILKEVA